MKRERKEDDYADIIDLPHHVSAKHPPMAPEDRAAQCAPFAALTGYEDAVKQTAEESLRETEQEIQRVPDPETMP